MWKKLLPFASFWYLSIAANHSVSTVVRLGEIAYYVGPIAKSSTIADNFQFEPCTVFQTTNPVVTLEFLEAVVERFGSVDDVWSKEYLTHVIFQSENTITIEKGAAELLERLGSPQIHYISNEESQVIPEGPYFLSNGQIRYAYRLYPDTHAAFVVATVESDHSLSYKALDAAAYGEIHPSSLTVAVPSRLRYTKSLEKPYAGVRLAVKDIMHLKGLKTTGGSRAYTELYGVREESADIIDRLLGLGFVIVGKTKTTQFADSEWPTCDYIDFHGPFNPRGDGYLTPSGSSSGSATAVAAYEWLDFALGTDTLGSIRSPAAAQGLYSMRPTVGSASFEGIIPYSPHWDTTAGFSRDARSFASLSSAIYSQEEHLGCLKKPTKLLVPSDYWPVPHAESQKVFDAFISKVETYLNVSKTEINLADTWKKSNPEGSDEPLDEYFKHVFEWSANPDQWGGFLKGFLQEYREKFGREAVLHPQLRFKSDFLPSISRAQQEEGLRRLGIYQTWFYQHIIPLSEDRCPESLLVLPWTNGEPDYRDKYRDGPQRFTGVGFFFYNVGPYANAPEILVPAGTTTYLSSRTHVEEQLPAGISIISATGTDVMLAQLVADIMSERPFPGGLAIKETSEERQKVVS